MRKYAFFCISGELSANSKRKEAAAIAGVEILPLRSFRLGSLARIFRLGSCVWDLSIGSFRLGSELGTCRLRSFAWVSCFELLAGHRSLETFRRLRSFAWGLSNEAGE